MTRSELLALPYSQYLKTPHWLALRRMMLGVYPHCALCRSTKNLNVHHNSYKNRGKETHVDLVVLCQPCHAKFHGKHTQVEEPTAKVTPVVKNEVDPDIARVEKLFLYYLERQARVTTFTDEYLEHHPFFTDVRYLQCVNKTINYKQITPRAWIASILNKLLINAHTKNNKIAIDMHVGYLKKASDSNGVLGIKKTLEVLFDPEFVDAKYNHEINKIELVFNVDKFKSPLILNAFIISSSRDFSGTYSLEQHSKLMHFMTIAKDMSAQIEYMKQYTKEGRTRGIWTSIYTEEGVLCGARCYETLKDFFDRCGVKALINPARPEGYKIDKAVTFFGTK